MIKDVKEYANDILYCFKLSLKIAMIPLVLGIVYTVISSLINRESIEILGIIAGIRSIGIIFSCAGLFICALGFLQPLKLLRPLSYNESWRRYFYKFGLVGAMFCICGFMAIYFLGLDVLLYYWVF